MMSVDGLAGGVVTALSGTSPSLNYSQGKDIMDGLDFDRRNYRVYRSLAVYTNPERKMSRYAIYSLAMSVYQAEEKAEQVRPSHFVIVRTNELGSYASWKKLKGELPRNAETEPPLVCRID